MLTGEELKQEGNKAFANKEYKKAAKIYRDAIQLDMYNPVLYSNRAQCFINLQDYQRAYRDTTTGINLGAPIPLLIKLYFRNGIASKGLNRLAKAKESFEMVLKLDATNSAAKLELKNLQNVNQEERNQSNEEDLLINIPIENVKELPYEFKSLLNPKSEPYEKPIEQPKIESPNIDKHIDELFGQKSKSKSNTPDKTHVDTAPSTMHYLTTLKFLPENQRAKGYKFVLNLDQESYENVFGSSGIETEFLQFFLDAAVYASTHESELPNWNSNVLNHLRQFSTFKKFELAMLMCNDQTKGKLIENIKRKYPTNLQDYQTYIK
ncbi:Heat shock protein sti1 [Spathaspora sp. JA1]|nr:Heat shock protein sti1 [Spathaspora sp. JA1]